MTVFFLLDNEGVIYKLEPQMRGCGAELMALTSNSNGRTNGSTMDLFIILTLEEEVCVFEAKLQQGDYLRDGHASPLGE